MPKFRTKKSDRTTYVYRDAYGKKVTELTPGDTDIEGKLVTADYIVILHGYDDDEHNTAKVDSYNGLLHYEQIGENEDALPDDRQNDLSDPDANPEKKFIEAMETAERSSAFKTVWEGLTDKQRDLVIKKLLKRTNTSIAKEEGTSETAVRKRLSKIQKKFEKFLI